MHDSERLIEDTLAICAAASPTGFEHERAALIAARLAAIPGVVPELDVHGNVLARIAGRHAGGPPVVVAAHLDTVFGPEVALAPSRAGGLLLGPGIGDNSLALAALLALAADLKQTPAAGDVLLAATVGEEGLGNLRGVRGLLGDQPARFVVALEGHGIDNLVTGAVGSTRLEIVCETAGGHSWHDRGAPSAVHELARAVTGLAYSLPPAVPGLAVNVGTFSGGTGINVIASRATLQLDLRAVDPAVLARGEEIARALVAASPTHASLALSIRELGRRPAGALGYDHPAIAQAQAARAAARLPSALLVDGSTDANAAFERGLPGLTVGLTRGGNVHREDEFIEIAPIGAGLAAALGLIRRLAGG
ncbi:MAG TPA: M20/M25/M40 family metallo-hydrolase [Chloroflexota bacterium]|jgi:acetylornithine deacetylase/succinyl-diaminopimelate desuccinylase-like protein